MNEAETQTRLAMNQTDNSTKNPRRIAFFVNQFPVISETFVVNLAKSILERDDTLDIYPIWGWGNAADTQPDVTAYKLTSKVPKPVVAQMAGQRLLKSPLALVQAFAKHGSNTINILPPLNRSPRALSGRLLHEAAQISGTPYDVIHCQFASLAAPVLEHLEAGTLAGKLVVHIRGYDITQEVRSVGIDVYREVFRKADHFIANSKHFAKTAMDLGCLGTKITVVPSGIDIDRFTFRQPTPRNENAPLKLITVGRLVDKKGIDIAIEAIARLKDGNIAATLDVIGSGPLEDDLKQQARALGLEKDIRFLGKQTADVIKDRLADSDLFIASSRTAANGDQDAGTNTVKEAMAVGVPVIASKHGGLPELIEEGQTGYLCIENDAASLSEAISRAANDQANWVRIAQNARELVVSYASNETVAEQVYQVYRNVMDQKS